MGKAERPKRAGANESSFYVLNFSTTQRNFTSDLASIDQGRLLLNSHLALLPIESPVSHPCLVPPLGCSRWSSDCLPGLRLLQPPADGALEVRGESQETR
jgi:hypothetical protein